MNDVIEKSASLTRPYSRWFEIHPALGISSIDHLFNRLDGAYPHKWRSAFPNQIAIDNWAESWVEAFEQEGILPADVKPGLKVCRNRYEWPPSCAEFIKACKPSVDPTVAYYEAIAGIQARQAGEMGTWSHSAIFWAAMPLSYDLGSQTYSQMKGRWEKALADQIDQGEWAPIPKPILALAPPGKNQLSREKAAKMLEELGASGIMQEKSEHTYWYRDILKRQKNGDRNLSLIQIKFAAEAAANHGYRP